MSVYITAIYENDNIDAQIPFAINNAGYIKIDAIDTHTRRHEGRLDYYLIYIKSGVGYFKIDKTVHALPAGSVVLYHPHEPQDYSYYACDEPEVYWIHFSGTKIEGLLTDLDLIDKHILEFEGVSDVINTTNRLIKELREKEEYYDTICASRLVNLLAKIARSIKAKNDTEKHPVINEIIDYMTDNYATNESIKDYAKICHMSESSFFKSFKRVTGMSPQHYKTLLRIKTAMSLLTTTDFSISQVASLVGYNDSLYFSKLFKKETNVSPKQYRISSKSKNGLNN